MDKQKAIRSFLEEQATGACIDLTELQRAAETFDCPLRDIEKVALRHSILPARYQRNGLSCSEQLKLIQARVAIIGCGGLGGRTAELLARLGIGTLLLTDPDTFSESNLNRQLFCTVKTLGDSKVEVLSRELQQINPALQTKEQVRLFNEQSIAGADIVIDCLDSTEARKELAGMCRSHAIPMIHGAVREWYGQVGIDWKANALINTLYPQTSGPPEAPKVMVTTVAFIAAIQAAEASKLLLGHDSPLTRGWLQCDLLHCEHEILPNNTT
ncbi:MAG: HesA/MoeB/ThiF family protein [Desulfocapsa sp.]|nr:HesA/MoeB/ThiF family protein [Desulfocapsa sp.]